MKYKVGDKVKIKTWKEMKNEFGVNSQKTAIASRRPFYEIIEKDIKELRANRILTISWLYPNTFTFTDEMDKEWDMEYGVKEFSYIIEDKWIKENPIKEIFEPIGSRFDILDIR